MTAALDAGHAHPHSRTMPFYAKYGDRWFTRSNDGTAWQRCDDPDHHARLDDTSARMRAADTAVDQLPQP
jgi:hypothetical protein